MVMNNSKRAVFGVVEKEQEPKEYTGGTTSTAKVTVDSENKVISVDVVTTGILGETGNTAYPGNLGAQSRELLIETIDNLDTEIKRAKDAEDKLSEQIENVTQEIDEVVQQQLVETEEKIDQLNSDIEHIETNYALKSELPDIDSFISEIPEEYITEDELTNKGYVDTEDFIKLLSQIEFIDGGTSSSLSI